MKFGARKSERGRGAGKGRDEEDVLDEVEEVREWLAWW